MGTPGNSRATKGNCISRECSRACAAECSWISFERDVMAAAISSATATMPNGVSQEPRGQMATPRKPTKCDGPTSTTAEYRQFMTSLYAWAATGPEYMRPVAAHAYKLVMNCR